VSAISYFLELEGIQTTGISLVRENTECLKPPRFLWTSFPLGRPLGKPGDPAFQRRVIMAALGLLERESGPVLEDYPEDLPSVAADEVSVCPVNFSMPAADDSSWQVRLANERLLMQPWYSLSLRRRGRTTVGIAKAPIEELMAQVAQALDVPDIASVDLKSLKYALEDLKAFYQEALTAQPGNHDPQETARIMWHDTVLGRSMLAIHDRLAASESARIQAFARGIAPRDQAQNRSP